MSASGSPTRPSGVRASSAACSAGERSKAVSNAGEAATGATQFTVTPLGPHSRARLLAMARSAAFTGEYSGMFALPSTPLGEVTMMKRPWRPASRRCGHAACPVCSTAHTPVCDMCFQWRSRSASSSLCGRPPRNALCTMMCNPPNRCTVAATHAATDSRLVMSVSTQIAEPPND